MLVFGGSRYFRIPFVPNIRKLRVTHLGILEDELAEKKNFRSACGKLPLLAYYCHIIHYHVCIYSHIHIVILIICQLCAHYFNLNVPQTSRLLRFPHHHPSAPAPQPSPPSSTLARKREGSLPPPDAHHLRCWLLVVSINLGPLKRETVALKNRTFLCFPGGLKYNS